MKIKKIFIFAVLGSIMSLSGCASDKGGGIHGAGGGLDVIKRHRKSGIVVIGGVRHIFDGPVDMEVAEQKALSQCQEWDYDSIELSSAKNIGYDETSNNVAAALGTIMGGHSPAGPVTIEYECYNK